jgi:hypothetical protein
MGVEKCPRLHFRFRVSIKFGSQNDEYDQHKMGVALRLRNGLLWFEPCRKRLPGIAYLVHHLDSGHWAGQLRQLA